MFTGHHCVAFRVTRNPVSLCWLLMEAVPEGIAHCLFSQTPLAFSEKGGWIEMLALHLEASVTTITCQSCVLICCLNMYFHHWSNYCYITQKPSKQQIYLVVLCGGGITGVVHPKITIHLLTLTNLILFLYFNFSLRGSHFVMWSYIFFLSI